MCFKPCFECPKSVSKGAEGLFSDTFRTLKTLVKALVFYFLQFWGKPQNVPDTFSDTPELPDTLLHTVLETF